MQAITTNRRLGEKDIELFHLIVVNLSYLLNVSRSFSGQIHIFVMLCVYAGDISQGRISSVIVVCRLGGMHAEQEMMQHDMSALTMHRPCESFDRQYELVAMIGTGAYGTVYKARDMLNGGHYVAMKRIRLSNSEEGMSMTAIREIALLKHLEKYEHPNIVR